MAKSSAKKIQRRLASPIWAIRNSPDARREAILREAAGCFNRQGYHGTTIEDIANRLHVTKAALYHYIANKEEILFECHKLALDLGMEGLRRADVQGGAPDERLEIALRHYIEGMTNTLSGTVVLLEEGMLTPKHYKDVVARRDQFERKIRALVQAGIAEGIFVQRNPKLVVFAMLGAANWISKWYSPEGELTASEIATGFVDYLLSGLRASTVRAESRKRGSTSLALHRP